MLEAPLTNADNKMTNLRIGFSRIRNIQGTEGELNFTTLYPQFRTSISDIQKTQLPLMLIF